MSYLKGLNTLRCLAAFFVIISHANLSMVKLQIISTPREWAFLNRGADAVEFFFVLSGFLITYLFFKESTTRSFSVKQFYLRRILRIWPLYFLICFIGFVGLGILYPMFTGINCDFPVGKSAVLYIFFLPNLATSIYRMQLLNPLWSLGVEEQFYLFWPLLVKKFQHSMLTMLLMFACVSTLFYVLSSYFFLDYPVLATLKFWAMSIGGLFGYILFHIDKIKLSKYLLSKTCQLVSLGIVIYYYLFGGTLGLYYHFLLTVLYAVIMLNVCMDKSCLIDLEKKPFVYLGTISYGLYMYHMTADYFLRLVYQKFLATKVILFIEPLYYLCLIMITILVASLSYRYFECPFLKLRHKNEPIKPKSEIQYSRYDEMIRE